MKNYKGPPNPLKIALPYDRTAGQGVLLGNLFGVCRTSGVSGDKVAIDIEGIFNVTKLSTDNVATVGVKLYWDDTNKRLTSTAGSNKFVGVSYATADGSTATIDIAVRGISPT